MYIKYVPCIFPTLVYRGFKPSGIQMHFVSAGNADSFLNSFVESHVGQTSEGRQISFPKGRCESDVFFLTIDNGFMVISRFLIPDLFY